MFPHLHFCWKITLHKNEKKFVNIFYNFLALCGFLKDNICNLQ